MDNTRVIKISHDLGSDEYVDIKGTKYYISYGLAGDIGLGTLRILDGRGPTEYSVLRVIRSPRLNKVLEIVYTEDNLAEDFQQAAETFRDELFRYLHEDSFTFHGAPEVISNHVYEMLRRYEYLFSK